MRLLSLELFFSTAALFMLSACQSLPKQAFRFDTHITTDGYKLFQLTYPARDRSLRLPAHGNRSRDRDQQLEESIDERQVLAVLEELIEDNGYCRQGYLLLGRQGGETTDRLRGECRDKATADDRKNHPNTLQRW